ncbi:PASTA domain-containing protein [Micromonospora haikouensis]|uniref:PASTA domain-containing protein n=1 Tax=Micromonospora haikouensis TaxID=686309 RepID=A0A1C4UHS8_9ACTN|nr:PASTA domain-containing protein [Micromonospora haikouensis]SCE71249.1 PASTA domain-containing protein [Micromonospora haikouensis]
MTDGNTVGEAYPDEADATGSGRSAKLLGGGLAVALLALAGAAGGWLLAGEDDPSPGLPAAQPDVSATAPPSEAPSSPARTTAPATRTTAPTRSTGLTVPPVVGTDFEDARDELRDLRLGWRLVFGAESGRDVRRADPPVGSPVSRGTTVALYVAGPAPEVSIPDLVGDDCDDAAEDLVEEGLYPGYPTGRTGVVTAQAPAADSTAHWNDKVALTCGEEPGEPSAEPPPTP